MRIDERVVLATALVHSIPGGLLVVADEEHRQLTIGRHPSAEIDPCRWRAAVVRVVRRDDPGLGSISLVDVAGSLARLDNGSFADRNDPLRRWLVVPLAPCAVADALRRVDLGGLPEDDVTATVRPDLELGLTLVGVAVEREEQVEELDELIGDVAGALLVAELEASLPVRR